MSRLLSKDLGSLTTAILSFNFEYKKNNRINFVKEEISGIQVRKEKDSFDITIPNFEQIGKPKHIMDCIIRHVKMKSIGRVSFYAEGQDAFVKVEALGKF